VLQTTISDARWTARTPARVPDVRTQVGISRTSMMRVIHSDLKLFPYKVQILQAQNQANKNQHYEFSQSVSDRLRQHIASIFTRPQPQTTSSGVTWRRESTWTSQTSERNKDNSERDLWRVLLWGWQLWSSSEWLGSNMLL